ncbi:MAG TPA: cation diffusion facilitator family transporter [Gammaproteobacteria bacterium]|nr:cation diffusion facilitator family transporter [Gammaproteobacteria bacterium]
MSSEGDFGEPKRTAEGEPIPSWPRALIGGAISAIPGTEEKHDGSIQTVAVAFISNLVVAIAKYAGFFAVQSSALLAEAIHSTAVTINQGLMLRGRLTARMGETPEHSFGFGRERYFWGFMVSVVMFGIGAVLSIGRGVLALASGEHQDIGTIWIPYATLTVGLLMDGTSLLQGLRQSRREKGDLSYKEYLKRSKNPEVPVVIFEDTAAMFGLFFAYSGISLTIILGNPLFDALASICVGMVLAVVSSILAVKMKGLLIGESALPEEIDFIRSTLDKHEHVREIVYVRSLYLAPDDLLVETKISMDPELGFRDVATTIDELERQIRRKLKHARLISIEPDVPQEGDVEVPGFEKDSTDGDSHDG